MKRILIISILTFFIQTGFGQIGINTETPDEYAALEISSTTKGLLIPRFTSEQRRLLGEKTPTTGITVFDVNERDYFVWDSTEGKWNRFNYWEFDEEKHKISIDTSLVDSITIDSELILKGEVKVVGAFDGVVTAGTPLLIKHGIVMRAGENSGNIDAATTEPYVVNTSGQVDYIQGIGEPEWNIIVEPGFGNKKAFYVDQTVGYEGTTEITFTNNLDEYGETKFVLTEGGNRIDSITMVAIKTSGQFLASDTVYIGCLPDGTHSLENADTQYIRGINGAIKANITDLNPLSVIQIRYTVIPPTTSTANWFQLLMPVGNTCLDHMNEDNTFELRENGNLLDTVYVKIIDPT